MTFWILNWLQTLLEINDKHADLFLKNEVIYIDICCLKFNGLFAKN